MLLRTNDAALSLQEGNHEMKMVQMSSSWKKEIGSTMLEGYSHFPGQRARRQLTSINQ